MENAKLLPPETPADLEEINAETTSTEETPSSPPTAPPPPPELSQKNSGFSFYGLYPLWESTGNMLGHRRFFVGTNWLAAGFARRFSLGIRPLGFFFRNPNVDFKTLVYEGYRFNLSLQLAPSLVLPEASSSFSSSNFTSRFDDNHRSLWLLPLSANVSWQILDELCLHSSLTTLGAFGKRVPNLQISLGLTVFAEFMPLENHALLLHVGEIGFWHHDFAMLGASYRFHWKGVEAQLGYFYRFSRDGNQGGPLFSLGILL